LRILRIAAIAALGLALSTSATAQDFGVMNSAETINKGNVKLMAHPIVVFGKGSADNETGIGLAGGYGFGDRFDVEAKLSLFDGLTFFGADAEYWLVNDKPVDVSVIGGFHIQSGDGFDSKGIDLTLLASGPIAERLELYGALDFSRSSYDGFDGSFTTVHLVPGIEYKVNEKVDFVTEVGLALNDNSSHYFSVGIAYYLRPRR
jgi:hypothetical protein